MSLYPAPFDLTLPMSKRTLYKWAYSDGDSVVIIYSWFVVGPLVFVCVCGGGGGVLGRFAEWLWCSSYFSNHLAEEEIAICFALSVLWLCSVYLPRGTVGCSGVCDCCISWSCLLTS